MQESELFQKKINTILLVTNLVALAGTSLFIFWTKPHLLRTYDYLGEILPCITRQVISYGNVIIIFFVALLLLKEKTCPQNTSLQINALASIVIYSLLFIVATALIEPFFPLKDALHTLAGK